MESTFIIQPSELNNDFLESVNRLFKYLRQLQITVTTSENFGLLKPETPAESLARLEKNLAEMIAGKNTVTYTEAQLDDLVFQKL